MKRWGIAAVLLTGIAGYAMTRGSAQAEQKNKTIMRIGPLQVWDGIGQEAFAKVLERFEKARKLQPSSAQEAKNLFATYDFNRDGRITADEYAAGLSSADAAKGKKKGCSPGPGPSIPSGCSFNTCDCTVITGPGEPEPGEPGGPERSPTWCGGDCHCHCNTFQCAKNGT